MTTAQQNRPRPVTLTLRKGEATYIRACEGGWNWSACVSGREVHGGVWRGSCSGPAAARQV
ncbi:hypothetical protein E2C01_099158 [Portunus trituberculatus]|uniref:Uncharacterized protein n=1 Tax=Portunus trituberculatus TaxID=210409 RepID=A0A5B7KA94_PORTR|nr:hypothetical protein [Portunus trituberculatus]